MLRLALLCLVSVSAFAITKPTLPQLQVDTSIPPVTGKSIAVNAGQDLQSAINAANPGDEIVLQAGSTWLGNYELPNKSGNGWITIRSSAMSKLPVPGNRVAPTDAANMATIMAFSVSPAFHLSTGAHQYRLMGLEITEKPGQSLNYGLIMQGDPSDTNAADLPNHIILDRCYVHGQVLGHIKFGWQMNGAYLAVVDSYFSEFHGLGQDTQAITGYMGPGPLKIVNNFLSGAGENVLFGGAYDAIPNTTTADVTFTGNYLYKPAAWNQQSLVPTPVALAVNVGSSGTLPAATYYYSVIAQGTLGTLDSLPGSAQSSRSAEAKVALNAAGSLTLSWTEANYGDANDTRIADNYVICRTTDAPGGNRTWTYLAYKPSLASGPLSFADDGSAKPISGFGEWARYWDVKNLFEVKNGARWLVDSNIMEGNWVSAQNGFSVLFTPRNEWPNMPGNTISDITFTNNVIRHVAGGFNIGSEDDTHPVTDLSAALVTARIAIANNLLEDVGYTYGNNGVALQFGAGAYPTLPGVQDLLIDHNTFFQSWSNAALGPADPAHPENKIGPFQFSNNVLGAGAYDWHFNGGGFDWNSSILPNFTSIDLRNNVWAGAPWNAQYPTANMFPAKLDDVGFANYAGGNGGDYHLAAASPYKGKASDGTDPGANMDTLNAVIAQDLLGQTAPPATQVTDPTPTPTVPDPTPTPVTAAAPPAIPTVWVRILSLNSGKCLTGQSDGTLAQLACSISNDGQLFTLVPSYGSNQNLLGYQFLMKSGVSLDVWGASGSDGAPVGQYKFKASSNEIFTLKMLPSGFFQITPNNSGKCLDITNVSKADGAKLQQWGCSTGANQQWSLMVQSVN